MDPYELVHPLYLDYQMMISFVAFLEGGFSLEDERKSTTQSSKDSEGKGSATAKTPSIFGFGLGATAEGSTSGRSENSTEYQEKRHRTEASYFNYLYKRLRNDGMVRVLSSADDLTSLKAGGLVEVVGKYRGNPLSDIVALAVQYYKYADSIAEEAEKEKKQQSAARRSGNPAARSAAEQASQSPLAAHAATLQSDPLAFRMMDQIRSELEASPVYDVLLSGFDGIETVLTVSAQYFTDATREFLREGEVRVMGKLTRVVPAGAEINLARRTLFGIAGHALTDSLETFFSENTTISAAKPLVQGPAIQILPMAIFV